MFEDTGISYIPSYSNSVVALFPDEATAAEFNQQMLERGVILRHLPGFGLPEGVRITIGNDVEMEHFESSLKDIASRMTLV